MVDNSGKLMVDDHGSAGKSAFASSSHTHWTRKLDDFPGLFVHLLDVAACALALTSKQCEDA